MHLRPFVSHDDVNMAIRVLLESYIGSQKYAVMNTLRKVAISRILAPLLTRECVALPRREQLFSRYITYRRDSNDLLLFILGELVREHISVTQFEREYRKQLRRQSGAAAATIPDEIQGPIVVEIPAEEFESRVCCSLSCYKKTHDITPMQVEEQNMSVLTAFYNGPAFNRAGFVYTRNAAGRPVIKKIVAI